MKTYIFFLLEPCFKDVGLLVDSSFSRLMGELPLISHINDFSEDEVLWQSSEADCWEFSRYISTDIGLDFHEVCSRQHSFCFNGNYYYEHSKLRREHSNP